MRPKHLSIPNTIYFITVRCARGLFPFVEEDICRIYLDVLCRKIIEKRFDVIAYVIMPDHIHLLVIVPESITLQKMMNHINGVSARKINDRRGTSGQKFWQGGFYDVRIRGLVDFTVKVNYVHKNPVKIGIVTAPEDYHFSSAKVYAEYCGSALIEGAKFDRSYIRKIRNEIPDIIKTDLKNRYLMESP